MLAKKTSARSRTCRNIWRLVPAGPRGIVGQGGVSPSLALTHGDKPLGGAASHDPAGPAEWLLAVARTDVSAGATAAGGKRRILETGGSLGPPGWSRSAGPAGLWDAASPSGLSLLGLLQRAGKGVSAVC